MSYFLVVALAIGDLFLHDIYTIPSSFNAFSRDEASSNVFLVDNFKMDFLRQHYCHGAREVTASDSYAHTHTYTFHGAHGTNSLHTDRNSRGTQGEEAIRNVAAKEDLCYRSILPKWI